MEQKISDAGPYNQRIDPHVLTQARSTLEREGRILRLPRANTPWFHLSTVAPADLAQRLAEQEPLHSATQDQRFTRRMGQTLEIAVYRALRDQAVLEYFGHFLDLEAHDDSQPYQKEEPPARVSQREIPRGQRFDFLLWHRTAGWTGVEVKNVREWLYPDRTEVKDMLAKACALDAVPVLIARRIPFVTFKLFHPCGLVIWQTYTQRYPAADRELAAQVADKRLLMSNRLFCSAHRNGRFFASWQAPDRMPLTLLTPARAGAPWPDPARIAGQVAPASLAGYQRDVALSLCFCGEPATAASATDEIGKKRKTNLRKFVYQCFALFVYTLRRETAAAARSPNGAHHERHQSQRGGGQNHHCPQPGRHPRRPGAPGRAH